MVGTSLSSSSSCASFGSLDEITAKPCSAVKFLCSYGGRILPRYPDGKLRYIGGETRVLAVDRSVSFSELQGKLGEMCGWEAVNLRCQLPTEDLDALVSVTSDEDLANLIEEYDLAARDRQCPLKIRAFLHPTPTRSPASASRTPFSPVVAPPAKSKASSSRNQFPATADRCVHQITSPARFAARMGNSGGGFRFYGHLADDIPAAMHHHLIHHGSHWH